MELFSIRIQRTFQLVSTSYIQTKYSAVQPTLTIPYTIFFLFFHVDNSRIIKTQVLQWINQKQQLMP